MVVPTVRLTPPSHPHCPQPPWEWGEVGRIRCGRGKAPPETKVDLGRIGAFIFRNTLCVCLAGWLWVGTKRRGLG